MRIKIGRDKLFLLGFFILVILAGSFLLVIPGMYNAGKLSYIDALFTATSAVCVTGLVVVDTANYSRLGQTIIMLLIQTGGLGIITFATLYIAIPRKKISLISKGAITDYSLSEVEYQPKAIIKAILKYTIFFELLGALFFNISFRAQGLPFFVAVFHSISAFCNAGFSTFSTNLEGYVTDPIVNFTTMFLIVIGGIGFIVIKDIRKVMRHQKQHLSYHSKVVLKTTAGLILSGAVAFFLLEYHTSMADLTFPQKIMASLFQSVTPRTAGFDTIAQNRMTQGSQLVTTLLMFIGASPASTGGGVKTTTFFILLATAFRYKDSGDSIVSNGRTIAPHTIYKAVGIVVKGIIIVFIGAVAIVLHEGNWGNQISLMDAVFETTSAFGTVGLSEGITSTLHTLSKLILIFTMYIGRVGLFAFALPKNTRDVEGYAALPGADIMI
ncbi:MAG: TrkH family potassium uptake protein [Spirochaetaceae bacterium]|nr:TrkH family potassium uptake protein [Spirochaetaceae bacterium]